MKHERLDGSDLETTKAAHEALLSAYARVADELSVIRSRRELMKGLSLPPGVVVIDGPFPPLVRYMVDSHARRQLRELRTVYTRLRHGRPPPTLTTEAGRAWLREAAEDTARFADALPRRGWLWDVTLTAATLVPASVIAWAFRPFGQVDARVLVGLGIAAPFGLALGVVLVTLHASFDAKRRPFGATEVGKRRASVYEREDALFGLLGRPKRKELPLDSMISFGLALLSAIYALVSAWNGFRMRNLIGGITWAVVAACLLGATAVAARKARNRLPPY